VRILRSARDLLIVVGVASAFLLLYAGCTSTQHEVNGPVPANIAGFPVTITDSRGKTRTLSAPPQRVVSLAPSNTEILFDLGAGDRIAADTTACDFPPEARLKPHIGGYPIDIEKVEAKSPDLVVAVESLNAQPVAALEKAGVPVLTVDAKTVAQTYDAILLLGKATGTEARAQQIVQDMKARIKAVRQKTAHVANRPKVLIAYGDNPIYTTGPGSFIDDLITIAGGQNIASMPPPLKNDVITPEQVLVRQPDVILCSPDLQQKLKQLPGWAQGVPAVRNNGFFTSSPPGILERPGPRLADGAEQLARYLHPELFAATPTSAHKTVSKSTKSGKP